MRNRNNLLTPLQIRVLKMKAEGMTFEEISRRLGVSKSSVYTVYKNAINNIEKARNTLRLYMEILGGIEIEVEKNTPIDSLISMILREADIHGIKIARSTSNILLYFFNKIRQCLNINEGVISCNLKIKLTKKGDVEIISLKP